MNWYPTLLLTALAVSQAVDQQPPNHVHYVMGGLMSGPLEYDIDFDTARFKLKDWDYLSLKSIKSEGTLSPEAADQLRRQARTAVAAGLENSWCRSQHAKGQIMAPS